MLAGSFLDASIFFFFVLIALYWSLTSLLHFVIFPLIFVLCVAGLEQ